MRPRQSRFTGHCAAQASLSAGCCAAILLRAEDSIRSHRLSRRDLFPTNHYHKKMQRPRSRLPRAAGVRISTTGPQRQEVTFGRNSQSQSSDPGSRRQWRRRRRYALDVGAYATAGGGIPWLQIFLHAQADAGIDGADPAAGTAGCVEWTSRRAVGSHAERCIGLAGCSSHYADNRCVA